MWTDFEAEVDISVMEVEKVCWAIDEEDEIDAREEITAKGRSNS
jgi:hypothetical protein